MLRSGSKLLPLAFCFALFACQDSESLTAPGEQEQDQGSTGKVGTGKGLTLLLTDAPGDFEAAVVTISQISLHGDGKAENLLDEPFTGDLIELRNEVATLVQGVELPAGSYSQLRLVIDGGYIEVETGNGTKIYASSPSYDGLPEDADVDGTLHMPSLGQSGLKINLPGGRLQIGEGETIVLLDFDVEESFGHEAGKSGKWVMHPVIKASNVTFGGFATARLQLAQGVTLPVLNNDTITLADFTALLVSASGDTTRIALTDADHDGIFEAMYKGLVPGTYSLSFVGPAGLIVTFGTTLPISITVGEKQTTTQTVTISSVAVPGTIKATLKADSALTLPTGVAPGQFKARLTPPDTTKSPVEVAFTDANNDQLFEANFPNLVPGVYALTLVPPTGVTATYDVTTLPVSVTVGTTGATVTQAFILKTAVKTP